jgi:hypothetical protein
LRRGDPIFPLIEKQTGLLAAVQIRFVDHAPFAHLNALWHDSVEDLDLLLEPFELPHARIVARQNARWRRKLDEQTHNVGHRPVDGL